MFSIPIEFILFAFTLLGVALFHRHTLGIAVGGTTAIALYKILFTGFKSGGGLRGFSDHLGHEWVICANLLCLLTGFALLSRHFEKSHVPVVLPKFLPHGWKGGFALLGIVWILSSCLDNIAGGLIGGAMAHQLFRAKVHIGYVAAIVAAANAGGAWSVVGDTTTTMMWIAGVSPARVFEAIVPSIVALFIFGIPAALQQEKYSPILRHTHEHTHIDWVRLGIVGIILGGAIAINVSVNLWFRGFADHFPVIGIAVWMAIALSIGFRRPDWEVLPRTLAGSTFLLALVLAASMMPVENLPPASWQRAFELGFLSAVFDNIPLTALALKQGGYDWGFLAYTVGFGGSMIWFGSSAGVALCNMFPEARSVGKWLRFGWCIPIAYIIAFFVMLGLIEWRPDSAKQNSNVHSTAKTGASAAYLDAPTSETATIEVGELEERFFNIAKSGPPAQHFPK
jgi:Na+/H+ antiporter NhaD/arsenite permease-like protein